jgi:Alpha-L-arabinofuranosidase B (ABFB) domain/Peptidase_C39 like family
LLNAIDEIAGNNMTKRLKRFSRKFLPFIIAGLTILATFTAASFSLLHPQSVNAQQVSRGDGYVSIQLPSTGNQDDSWSCGPNSAARVLAFYGNRVDYDTVRSVAQRDQGIIPTKVCVGKGVLKKCFNTGQFKTGLEPGEIRDVMNRWEKGNAKYVSGANLDQLKSLLSQGKPVLVLRRVGTFKPGLVFGTWPEMHWVAVHGFNDRTREISFTDTNGTTDNKKSYDDFFSEWDWRIGDGLASEIFRQKGVKPKTMVWVDRTPPSLASNSSTSDSLISLQSVNFPSHYIRHANFFGYISGIDSDLSRNDATWNMVPGLANSQCTSFESKNFPGHYLRHQDLRIKLHRNDNTSLFNADATFCPRSGLADSSAFSFESFNFPNHYIRHRASELWVDPQANDELYKKDATFRIANPFIR